MIKYFFLHVPKCAGVSIMHSLWDLLGSRKEIREIHHYPQKTIRKFEDELKKSFVFIFSRNPWDRFISSFFYSAKRYNPNKLHIHTVRKACFESNGDINFFIEKMKKNRKFESKVTKSFHFRPQKNWVCDEINFYGRYENLVKDFKKVSRIIKPGSKNTKLRSLNVSNNRDRDIFYQSYFSKENAEYIGELYREDVSFFKYKFN